MHRHATFLPVLALFSWGASAAAGPSSEPDPAHLALVERFVTDIRTLTGRFEQTLVDADNQVVEMTRGTLEIRRPGQFRWRYTEPYEQILVADGLNVWSYDVDLAQVTVKPQREVLDNTPAMLLGGSKDALDQFVYLGSLIDRGTVWVQLMPKEKDNGFTKVELGFNDGMLTRMMFLDNLEQTTLIALFDVSLNVEMEPERFHFELPDGVDVVGTPAAINASTPGVDSGT